VILIVIRRDKNVFLYPRFEITLSQKRRNCISWFRSRQIHPADTFPCESRKLDWQSARGYEWCIVKCAGDTNSCLGAVTGPPPAQSILLILRDVKSAQLRARAPIGRREIVPSPPSWDHLPTAKGDTNRRSLDAAYAAPNLFFMSTWGELRKGRAIVS